MKVLKYKLDKSQDTPLYVSLYEHIKSDIISGRIADNERLPSRRSLSESTGLSKNTVELAYAKLVESGYAISRARSGYYARQSSPINTDIDETNYYPTDGIKYTLSHNGIDKRSIPKNELSKIYRDITHDSTDLYEFGHKYGEKTLRKAISYNLFDLHGIKCKPSQIIVGAGSEYLIEQLAHIFDEDTVFGFENPSFARNYIPVKNSGVKTRLIDIGTDGITADALRESGVDVICLTPDCQFPTANRLSSEVRSELLKWAGESDTHYIIEAEYDLDFSNTPLDTLYASDTTNSVILLGSFFRSVAASFRTGFIAAPPEIIDRFNKKLPYYICLKSAFEQEVIARYITSGAYRKHAEKLREIYNAKRGAARRALENSTLAPRLKIYGADTDTFFIISLDSKLTEAELRSRAVKFGVKTVPLSACLIRYSDKLPPKSFIFGFGALEQTEISEAVSALEVAWNDNEQA